MKVLVKKTFNFVNDVWRAYIRWKIPDLRYVHMCGPLPISFCFNCSAIDENECGEDSNHDDDDDLLADGEDVPEDDTDEMESQE